MRALGQISGRYHTILIHRVEHRDGAAVPVLWLFHGTQEVFTPLVHYFNEYSFRGLGWKRKAARAVGLFYDYSLTFQFDEANSIRNRYSTTIKSFIDALRHGTILQDGADPSGLFWPPMSAIVVVELANHLDQFFSHVSEQLSDLNDSHPLKSMEIAFTGKPRDGATMVRFMMAAKRLKSKLFLSHINGVDEEAARQQRATREFLGAEFPASGERNIKMMAPELISRLLEIGFVKNSSADTLDEREDVTAKMFFLLLAGGGLRQSEPLHMWFNDVTFPQDEGEERCVPMLRHPSQAATHIIGENCSRIHYLKKMNMLPRHLDVGQSLFAGWKNLPLDKNTKSTEVIFIHPTLESQFAEYFHFYLNLRRKLVAARVARGESGHPFLFVSSGEDRDSGKSYIGSPYSKKAFNKAFNRALDRVELSTGEIVPRGKDYGTTPHALRHSFGNTLMLAGVPQKAIQRAMNHRSVLSQEAYTKPTWKEVTTALSAARSSENAFLLNPRREYEDPYDETRELKRTWRY